MQSGILGNLPANEQRQRWKGVQSVESPPTRISDRCKSRAPGWNLNSNL